MSQPESRLQRRIRTALEEHFGGFWYKVWGGPFQPAGIPDLAGVVEGRAVFVEVKRYGGLTTPVQRARMRELRSAGAIVAVARSPEDATRLVQRLLTEHCDFCLSCEQIVELIGDVGKFRGHGGPENDATEDTTCSECGGER